MARLWHMPFRTYAKPLGDADRLEIQRLLFEYYGKNDPLAEKILTNYTGNLVATAKHLVKVCGTPEKIDMVFTGGFFTRFPESRIWVEKILDEISSQCPDTEFIKCGTGKSPAYGSAAFFLS
jgi:N-acetylglucosamine kinase-like BadF-type ATPase